MHIHINPVGGIAGDMFVAAVTDLLPGLELNMMHMLRKSDLASELDIRVEKHRDSVMVGRQFKVGETGSAHHHVGHNQIRDMIHGADLSTGACRLALQILDFIVEAESVVHGVAFEDVVLHEAGSMDSCVDVICSAFLIDALGDASWSCDPLPSGSGSVMTEHGELPIPVPAVVHLLKECPMFDDGRTGERVTPTGAAILRAINPDFGPQRKTRILMAAGNGFGTAKFAGISNVLRLLAYESRTHELHVERIAQLAFEVDDQSPEDLAVGLDRIREFDGVLDVIQIPAVGKKGRVTVHVQVLGVEGAVDGIAECCLRETSTLGVRYRSVSRTVAIRRLETHQHDGSGRVPVKLAQRPGSQLTAKVESDYLSAVGDYSQRRRLRRQVESDAEQSDGAGG